MANVAELLTDIGDLPIDLFLETSGGATDATEAIISLIQSSVLGFRVIVANYAKSNGTLLALAAKQIIMGATSELGPIEPSLGNIPCSILDTPQVAASNFPLHMAGRYALQQSRSVAKSLLTNGMMNGRKEEDIDAAIHALASRDKYPSHGSVVDHQEAKSLGLNIEYLPPTNELWKRIWLLYCMYEHDCGSNQYIKLFESSSRSLAIAAPQDARTPSS